MPPPPSSPALHSAFGGKRVLVTGGAGMIGSHLVRRLLVEGASVTVLDDLSSGRWEFLPEDPRLKMIEGDITDSRALSRAFEPKPEFVFHLAALFANQNSVDHPARDLTVNGMGTLQVLDLCRLHGVRRVVFASSSCVYPADVSEMREDTPGFSFSTPYAITKLLGERYVLYFHRHFGLPATVIRYFNCYGPHEHPGPYRNVIPNMVARALQGKPLAVHGDGGATRDFTYVEDTVEGTCLAAIAPRGVGEVFNIGTGAETRVIDLAQAINHITGNKGGIEFIPSRDWDKVVRRRADISRARELLGYRPRWTLQEGLVPTYRWLKSVLVLGR